MCCFAGHVSDVSGTNIFARVGADRQHLVYEMTFTSNDQTAMILPIPTASGRPEDVVTFVSLEGYPDFFRDLERHFQEVWAQSRTLGGGLPSPSLKVYLVGAFEASFVPRLEDFDRLDVRFRLPPHVWRQLPVYESFGFVVFKLQPGTRASVHPMAFSFRTRDPETVFFPTVHVHDTLVHEMADFDHILYTQNEPARGSSWPRTFWMPGGVAASRYLKVERTSGLVSKNVPCFQMAVIGRFPNRDIVVPISLP
jgi:hypothetical protein